MRQDEHDHAGHTGHVHGHGTGETAIPKQPWTDWLPLATVFGYILGLSGLLIVATDNSVTMLWPLVMGLFFIFFSLFKVIDIPAFAKGYQEYDLISRRWRGWGYVYPWLELCLGAAYILALRAPNPLWLHIVTIIVSLEVCVSVAIKLAKRETFQCACLGTVLKVPLTKVSLIEYVLMGAMAALMALGVV